MKGIVTLEDARRLAEAGIEIETYWAYEFHKEVYKDHYDLCPIGDILSGTKHYPAPSVGEILDWLPEEIDNCPLTLMPAKGIGYLDSWSPTYQAWLADVVGGTPEAALVELALWVAKEGKK